MDMGHIMPTGSKELPWPVFLLFLNMVSVAIGFTQPNSLSVAVTNRKCLGKAFKKQERHSGIFPLVYPPGFQQSIVYEFQESQTASRRIDFNSLVFLLPDVFSIVFCIFFRLICRMSSWAKREAQPASFPVSEASYVQAAFGHSSSGTCNGLDPEN